MDGCLSNWRGWGLPYQVISIVNRYSRIDAAHFLIDKFAKWLTHESSGEKQERSAKKPFYENIFVIVVENLWDFINYRGDHEETGIKLLQFIRCLQYMSYFSIYGKFINIFVSKFVPCGLFYSVGGRGRLTPMEIYSNVHLRSLKSNTKIYLNMLFISNSASVNTI